MMATPFSCPLLPDDLLDQPAILDDTSGEWVSYAALRDLTKTWKVRLAGSQKALVFLYVQNDIESVAALLGAQSAGHAVALLDPALPLASRRRLENVYQPNWVIGPDKDEVVLAVPTQVGLQVIHPDLALLLSTSGSTGSPKFVRLSLTALAANAAAIAEVLRIGREDTASGYLPLHYSYGLSVLTSHFAKGARVRLTKKGFTDREFWPAMREAAVTHIPGVPFHFQILQKLGFKRLNLPSLKVLTQAGGTLALELRQAVHQFMESVGGRFYVMYGQTEASPRMTTLQHDDFLAAPTSVGSALPGCKVEIVDPSPSGEGEVMFVGPNVMMGYAENREDLSRGDELSGRLLTGDVGRLGVDGQLTLVGRTKRFGKVYGLRVNLDELEAVISSDQEAAVLQVNEFIVIYVVNLDGDEEQVQRDAIFSKLAVHFTLPRSAYRLHAVEVIPRTDRGKIDYHALESLS